MTDSQKLLELAKQNNGIITTAMVARARISRGTLKYLSDTGRLKEMVIGEYPLDLLDELARRISVRETKNEQS